jgi:hypothetical protein
MGLCRRHRLESPMLHHYKRYRYNYNNHYNQYFRFLQQQLFLKTLLMYLQRRRHNMIVDNLDPKRSRRRRRLHKPQHQIL